MVMAAASLILGLVIGYLGQRSRLCFIGGYRDFLLARDTTLLKGVLAAVRQRSRRVPAVRLARRPRSGLPSIAHNLQFGRQVHLAVDRRRRSGGGHPGRARGGCPFRMHVLACEGRKTYWAYLLGVLRGAYLLQPRHRSLGSGCSPISEIGLPPARDGCGTTR